MKKKKWIQKIALKISSLFCFLAILLSFCTTAYASDITVYSQLDSRWSNHSYGYSDTSAQTPTTIGKGGCGILALVNAVYYMNSNFISPKTLADYSVKNGYRVNGVGTSHALYTIVVKTLQDICSHSYGEWHVTAEATCILNGNQYRTCSICGLNENTIISAHGHDFSSYYTVDAEATCTTAGSKSQHCSRCSAKQNVTAIPATGHSYSVTSEAINATCEKSGVTATETCYTCGNTIGGEIISPTGHNMQLIEAKIESTCADDGKTAIYACANGCGATEGGDTIDATGHSFATTSEGISPTCTEEGISAIMTCTICGDSIGGETIAPHGHEMEETAVEISPTCTEDGRTAIYSCANGCGNTVGGETVPALGHDFDAAYTVDVEATCTAAGSKSQHCSRCSAKQNVTAIPAKGHSYGAWIETTPADIGIDGEETRTCSSCGDKETRSIPALEEEVSEDAVTIAVSSTRGGAGKTVTVDISLENNINGFGGLEFYVSFDNTYLTLDNIAVLEEITKFTVTPKATANTIGEVAFSYAGLDNVAGEGKIATLTFTISENAEDGKTLPLVITVPDGSAFYYEDYAMVDLAIAKINGKIEVCAYTLGDTDGNGTINIRDAALILQYCAKWDVEIDLGGADADGNGTINIRDAALILQYCAKWDVALG